MIKKYYKVYIKDYTGDTSLLLPITPAELPEVSSSADIDDFLTSSNGYYTIIGTRQMSSVSAEHLMPKAGKNLTFALSKTKGTQLTQLLATAMNREWPIKYVITLPSGGYYVNCLFAVESWSYKLDKKEDYIVSFSLKEWKAYAGWADKAQKKVTPKLSTSSLVMEVGENRDIRLNNAIGKVTWATNNRAVASVTNGKITARKAGQATITATHKKKKYKCTVKVKRKK